MNFLVIYHLFSLDNNFICILMPYNSPIESIGIALLVIVLKLN